MLSTLSLLVVVAAVNIPQPVPSAAPAPAPAEEAAAPVEPKASRIAVYELKAEGIEPRTALIVTEALVAELRKLQRTSVVSMDEVKAMLDHEAQKQLVGCSDESCLAEIADSLGVDGLVIGTVAHIAGENIIGIKRLDQRQGAVVGSATRRLQAADGTELLAAIGPLVEEVFPDVPLRVGAKRGVDDVVALRLNPPPVPTWAYWTTAATTGVLAVAGVTTTVVNRVAVADHDAFVASSVGGAPVRGLDVKSKQDVILGSAVASWVFLGTAIVGGGMLALMPPFTDWQNLAGEGGAQ
jgi:hypothetical protein